MGLPEDKVNLLNNDDHEAPVPTVVDEDEVEDSPVCKVLCYSLTYIMILGIFLSAFAFHSTTTDDKSLYSRQSGYRAHVRQIRPGERFDDEILRDIRMRDERRRMKMFPMFKSEPESSYDPPPRFEKAKTARYIVHNSDWGSVSTISASMDGAPFGMAISFSDGTVANSTGVPYFYLTKDDPVAKNIESNQLSSLALSEAQSGYCKAHNWDPEEPLCSRVTLIGKLVHVGPGELKFAQDALFSRHPVMKTWPKDHDWQTLKMEITHVWLLDYYGPATIVSVEDYFKAKL